MKKLIDILEYHIPNYDAMTEEQQDDLLVAVEEWAKRTPTYKPPSELHKDTEACRKIFEFVTPAKFISANRHESPGFNHTGMAGQDDNGQTWLFFIYDDETFSMESRTSVEVKGLFQLVDLIRSLGYSA